MRLSIKRFTEIAKEKGWHPYIKSTLLDFTSRQGKYEVAFQEHNTITCQIPISRIKELIP